MRSLPLVIGSVSLLAACSNAEPFDLSGAATTTKTSTSTTSGTTSVGGHGGGAGGQAQGTGGAGAGEPGGGTGGTTTTTSGAGGEPLGCPSPGDPPDCSPGSSDCSQGFDGPSCFYDTVRNAVTYVVHIAHPEWIDWSSGNAYVLEPELYMDAVVAEVRSKGLCAIRDPNAGDEIAVKHDHELAENFDILTWQGWARWGAGIYNGTCVGAWF